MVVINKDNFFPFAASSRTQTSFPATSSPRLYNSGYDFITLKLNTSAEVSRSVAFYILQVQLNIQSLNKPLELPPSIPRHIMVRQTAYIFVLSLTCTFFHSSFHYHLDNATAIITLSKLSFFTFWPLKHFKYNLLLLANDC